MTLTKSTKVWLALFAGSVVMTAILDSSKQKFGCLGSLVAALAVVSGLVLLAFGIAAAFRAVVRRLTLRLAFSYFLIGIVPIPLLATILFAGAYLVAHQIIATRIRDDVSDLAESAAAKEGVAEVRVGENGQVSTSDVPWLRPGDAAPWAKKLDRPRALVEGENLWIAVPNGDSGSRRIHLVPLNDPSGALLQRLADRTGYALRVEAGRTRQSRKGWEIDTRPSPGRHVQFSVPALEPRRARSRGTVRPRNRPEEATGFLDGEWVTAVYIEKAVETSSQSEKEGDVVVYIASTSPRLLAERLFAQGVPAVGRVFWAVMAGLSGAILLVYLVALAIAFGLVGSIARNVNRLTRATRAIAKGDFSARVGSRSRDQIGDLARSFDGMAASIQHLLAETAKKERLEGEIAVARTIQQKLLPAPEAQFPGLSVLGQFQPVAEIGGDYYDYIPMPDGRIAIAIGDVSGHGLPTGLLAAMAKAALSTLIESGLTGSALLARLNELIHRSTDSRNYMTLALFAYDRGQRAGELTNAGQLAPYHLAAGSVQSLSLPSFPLGASARSDFPTKVFSFSSGDRLLFLTDGLVEAENPTGEPFGFERLETLLQVEAFSPAPRLREAVLSAVAAHAGGSPASDDRTLLLLTVE